MKHGRGRGPKALYRASLTASLPLLSLTFTVFGLVQPVFATEEAR